MLSYIFNGLKKDEKHGSSSQIIEGYNNEFCINNFVQKVVLDLNEKSKEEYMEGATRRSAKLSKSYFF